MKSESNSNGYIQGEQNYKLGMILLAGLIVPVLFFFATTTHHEIHPLTQIIVGIYFQYVGVLSFLSYYYEDKSFIFRWFVWIALHRPFPSREGVMMQGIVSFVAGTIFLVTTFLN